MISISKTLEMRWFERGKIPNSVYQWFIERDSEQIPSSPEHRLDRYFYLPFLKYFSLKIRRGNLECKWRDQPLGTYEFPALSPHQEYTGLLEKWQKWSFDGDYLPDIATILPKAMLIDVEKTRWLHFQDNIQFELSQLSKESVQWWSFAVEIEQDTSTITGSSLKAIHRFLHTYPQNNLSLQKSYAYPQWFQENPTH